MNYELLEITMTQVDRTIALWNPLTGQGNEFLDIHLGEGGSLYLWSTLAGNAHYQCPKAWPWMQSYSARTGSKPRKLNLLFPSHSLRHLFIRLPNFRSQEFQWFVTLLTYQLQSTQIHATLNVTEWSVSSFFQIPYCRCRCLDLGP